MTAVSVFVVVVRLFTVAVVTVDIIFATASANGAVAAGDVVAVVGYV